MGVRNTFSDIRTLNDRSQNNHASWHEMTQIPTIKDLGRIVR